MGEECKLQFILDNLECPAVVVNQKDGKIIEINTRARTLLGINNGKLSNLFITQFFKKTDLVFDKAGNRIVRLMTKNKTAENVGVEIIPDQKSVFALIKFSAGCNDETNEKLIFQEKYEKYLHTTREALAYNEKLLQGLALVFPELVFITDRKKVKQTIIHTPCLLLDGKGILIDGCIIEDCGFPADVIHFIKKEVIKDSGSSLFMHNGKNKDSQKCWFELIMHQLDTSEYIVVIRNITGQKEQQKDFEKNKLLYNTLFERATSAVFIVKNKKFLDCNKKALKLFGVSNKKSFAQKLASDFSPQLQPDGISSFDGMVQHYMAAKVEPSTFYWQHRKADGTLFDARVSMAVIEVDGDEYIYSYVDDVTEEKRKDRIFLDREKHYHLLMKNISDVVWTMDLNMNFTYVTPSIKTFQGLTQEECTLDNIFTPEGKTKAIEAFSRESRKLLKGEIENPDSYTLTEEFPYKHKNGSTIWGEVKASFVFDEKGQLSGIQGVTRNINARKQEEILRKEWEHKLNAIIDNAPFGALEYELLPDNRLVLIGNNNSASEIIQRQLENFYGKTIEEIFPELTHTKLPAAYRKIAKSGGVFEEENVSYRDDIIVGAFSVRALQIKQGKVVVFFRDVTHQKQYEEKLENTNKLLKEQVDFTTTLLNTMPNPVFYKDVKGKYLGFSNTFCDLLGISPGELLGKTVLELYEKDLAETYHKADMKLIRTRGHQQYEGKLRNGNGELRSVIFNKSVFYNAYGKVAGILGVVSDITDLRKTMLALEESKNRYRHLFDDSFEGVILFKNGEHYASNKRLKELFGIRKKEFKTGPHFFPDFQANGKPSLKEWEKKLNVLEKEKNISFEWQFVKEDGSLLETAVNMSMYYLGEDRYIQTFIRDISESNRLYRVLSERERSMRMLMNNLPGMVYRSKVDEDWTIEFVSDGIYDLTGFKPEELIVKKTVTSYDIIHPDDVKFVKATMQKYIRMRKPFQMTYRILTKKNQLKWVWEQGEAVFGHDKKPIAIEGLLMDISQQKEFEQELVENQRKYFTLFSKLNDAILIVNGNKITDCNEKAAEVYALPMRSIIGKNILDFQIIDDKTGGYTALQLDHYLKASGDKKPQLFPWRFRRGDGRTFDAEVSISGFSFENQFVHQIIVRDITERIISESKIREGRRNYERLVDNLPDGVIINIKGVSVYANSLSLQLLGAESADVISQEFLLKNTLSKSRSYFKKHLADAETGIESPFFDIKYKNPLDNQMLLLEIKLLNYTLLGQDASQMVIRDISARKELERERLRATVMESRAKQMKSEMEERSRSEKIIRQSLEEKEVLLKEIHHRVKNNLQVISSILNLQAGYIESESIKQMIVESQDRIKTMALVHENLYRNEDISKIDFQEYVDNLVKNLYRSYGIDSQEVKLDLAVDKILFNLDVGIPCGLIINELVSNSLKYAFCGRKQGKIRIEARQKSSGEIMLRIEDDGVGLPDGLNIRNTRSLGLQLVITLVDQLEGKLDVCSIKGTCFNITFKNNKS
jgi:PAS domain S-box-containing protein